MTKLTVRNLESLTQADVGKRLSDEHALYGRVKAKGDGVCVMFRWRYRFDDKLYDFTCGTWPARSLKEIRNACESARRLLEQGQNPNESKRIARLDEKAAQVEALTEAKARVERAEALNRRITVAELFERWAAVELIRRKDGGKEVRRMFRKDVLPSIGSLAVEDIRKAHVTAVTDALLARGVTRMAKVIFSLIRQMFRFAVDRDLVEADPTAAIRKGRIGGKDVERDRVLSEDEIRALRRQIHRAGLLVSTEAAVWLALATGCRIGELLRAEWKHVRLNAGEWFIPADNSKNGKPNTIYLSDFALNNSSPCVKSTVPANGVFPIVTTAGMFASRPSPSNWAIANVLMQARCPAVLRTPAP